MSYFGYTNNWNRRLEEHIMDALEPHGEGQNYAKTTKLHQAIREGSLFSLFFFFLQ